MISPLQKFLNIFVIGFDRSIPVDYKAFGKIQVLPTHDHEPLHVLIIMQSKQRIKKNAKINKRLNFILEQLKPQH